MLENSWVMLHSQEGNEVEDFLLFKRPYPLSAGAAHRNFGSRACLSSGEEKSSSNCALFQSFLTLWKLSGTDSLTGEKENFAKSQLLIRLNICHR